MKVKATRENKQLPKIKLDKWISEMQMIKGFYFLEKINVTISKLFAVV